MLSDNTQYSPARQNSIPSVTAVLAFAPPTYLPTYPSMAGTRSESRSFEREREPSNEYHIKEYRCSVLRLVGRIFEKERRPEKVVRVTLIGQPPPWSTRAQRTPVLTPYGMWQDPPQHEERHYDRCTAAEAVLSLLGKFTSWTNSLKNPLLDRLATGVGLPLPLLLLLLLLLLVLVTAYAASERGMHAVARRRREELGFEVLRMRNKLMHEEQSTKEGSFPAFVPRAGDVFVVTYPKCGTTWMMQIVHGLRSGGSMDFGEVLRPRMGAGKGAQPHALDGLTSEANAEAMLRFRRSRRNALGISWPA
eukprot:scaffold2979_cov243-Pinguiococcus_pyrenoidosus.AAC.5